jgi:hypothetical protein
VTIKKAKNNYEASHHALGAGARDKTQAGLGKVLVSFCSNNYDW